ncbi:hypothetical protein C8245_22870 [Paracidovorax avenae]|nr:hypothetical protein C8245_22870 [Paracidovorax avenae]
MLENYAGCSARVQFRREIGSPDVLFELNTTGGGIVLDGSWMRFRIEAAATSAMNYGAKPPAWESCIGQVEVTRPNGDVERQYVVTCRLSPEGTK